jgi:hypothetical protein
MSDPTICIECEHLCLPDGKNTPWFFWLCEGARRRPEMNYVNGELFESP